MGGGGVFDAGYLSARPASWHLHFFASPSASRHSHQLAIAQSLRNNSLLFYCVFCVGRFRVAGPDISFVAGGCELAADCDFSLSI